MMGESHALLGAVATGAILMANGRSPANQGWISFGLAVGLGALVALLPDIDSPNTSIRTLFGLGRRQSRRNAFRWRGKNLFQILMDLVRWVAAMLLNLLARVLPHRGPTHWLLVAATLCYAMYRITIWQSWDPLVWQAFTIGYFSHLVADGCTKSGVKLFAPFYDKAVGLPFSFLRVRTGSPQEGFALLILVALLVAWVAYF